MNALNDLTNQMRMDNQCKSNVQALLNLFTNGYAKHHPMSTAGIVGYLQNNPGLYDGPKSTLMSKYALCGENNYHGALCNGDGYTVKQEFEGSNGRPGGLTAFTVTPSEPFKSFFQPTFYPPPPANFDPDAHGFGIGINPANMGMNIFNESILRHEALHGRTGLYDGDIQSLLHHTDPSVVVEGPSVNISIYIKADVLGSCPRFK